MRTITLHPPVPTRRCLILLGGGVAFSWMWAWNTAVFFAAGFSFLCALDYVLGGADVKRIRATRRCPHRWLQNISQKVEITLASSGIRQRGLQIRDQTPLGWSPAPIRRAVLGGRGFRRLSYRVTPKDRGRFAFGDIWLRAPGPLGLMLREFRETSSQEVMVLPGIRISGQADLSVYRRRAREWGARPARLTGTSREFESLRDYVQGDDIRKLHWKATARFDRPITQEFQAEQNQLVVLALDAGRLMGALTEGRSKFDHCLEAAMQLVQTALRGGDRVGVLAFAQEVIAFVPPRKGSDQFQRILGSVGTMHATQMESQYEQAMLWLKARVRRRSLVVVFTDLVDEVASEALLAAVGMLRPRHLPLCVAVSETEWRTTLEEHPNQISGLYERAVLQGLLRQRAQTLGRLTSQGSLAVDLPASQLTSGAIRSYLEVKQKGLL